MAESKNKEVEVQIPDEDCLVGGAGARGTKSIVILNKETSKNIIYNQLIGWDLARYKACFVSNPTHCPSCQHEFEFEDRLAAALLLNAHGKDRAFEFLREGPTQREYLKGLLYCSTCREFVLAQLEYGYGPNMLANGGHTEAELRMLKDVTVQK